MAKFQSVDELVEATRPVNPVYCIREDSIETSAAWFKNNFPGQHIVCCQMQIQTKKF